jgi:arylsulfatase
MSSKVGQMRRLSSLAGTAVLMRTLLSVDPAAAQAPQPGNGNKPKIVFILTDNLGYGEPGVYGGGISRGAPTPRIDQLAAEGMRLTNFNVEAQCAPSRSAIMPGRGFRAGAHGVRLPQEPR